MRRVVQPQSVRAAAESDLRRRSRSGLPGPVLPEVIQERKKPWIGTRLMTAGVNFALLSIGINAVLIQTIVPEESQLKNVVRGVVLGWVLLLILLRRARVPRWIIGLALLSLCLMFVSDNPDQLSIIFILLLAPSLWSIPERSLDRAAARASLVSLGLVFVLLAAGITQNRVVVSSTELVARERVTFGTAGVPFFMNVLYGAAALTIYYAFRWNLRSRWVLTLIAIGGSLFCYVQTDGRGGLLALILFCGLALALPLLSRIAPVRWMLTIQPLIYLGFALGIASQQANLDLNEFLSYRPRLYGAFLESLDPLSALWGTSVKQTAVVSTVDNSYLHLLMGAGVVTFTTFSVLFARAVTKMLRQGMTLELAFLTAAMAYSVSESILLRIENVFIIYAWYLVIRHGGAPRNILGQQDGLGLADRFRTERRREQVPTYT